MDLGIYIFWLLLRIDMLVDILLQKNYYWNVRFPRTCVSLDELQLERNVTFKSDAEGAPFVKRETDDISILCSGINHPDVLSGWRTGSIIYLNLLKRLRKWRIIIDPCTEMYADSIDRWFLRRKISLIICSIPFETSSIIIGISTTACWFKIK